MEQKIKAPLNIDHHFGLQVRKQLTTVRPQVRYDRRALTKMTATYWTCEGTFTWARSMMVKVRVGAIEATSFTEQNLPVCTRWCAVRLAA